MRCTSRAYVVLDCRSVVGEHVELLQFQQQRQQQQQRSVQHWRRRPDVVNRAGKWDPPDRTTGTHDRSGEPLKFVA
nr:MAG TPA: hypothetical protein [Caudoviricetes sp.]